MSTLETTRRRGAAMLFATVTVLALWCSSAPLQAATTTSAAATSAPATTTSTTPTASGPSTTTTQPLAPPGPEVLDGVTVGAAVVTTPGQPTRHLDVDQNSAFMQTWLPTSIVSKLPHQSPPSCLPVSRLHSTISYSRQTTPMLVYYATDGVSVWVGMPAQSLGFAAVTSLTWIASPEPSTTMAAFEGNLAPADIASGVSAPTLPPSSGTTIACDAATGKVVRPAAKASSSSNTWVWIVIPIAVVVIGLGGWLLVRNRSRAKVA